ncbi:MAG: putative SprT family Zn-dependent metalloprotease [Pseudohongiellaceae bacterium]|jgi:predicted SprT family Zn-dependent metalloprotease|uniref:SprT-like domain-containing protein n=1 Tax=Zhongshania guokunii TaxID=641783 RepID=A0ABV3U6E4_9GAMM
MTPSQELYSSLHFAYSHFNDELFGNELPVVIFTVQRTKGVMGYFSPKRWGSLGGRKCDEIAINPAYVANSRLIEVMQTLVHEMVHCWQYNFGNPGRSYYHNKEWAMKMIDVGLMPSSTGEPGGDITGQQMGDYIIEGGRFLVAFTKLEKEGAFQLAWVDRKALPRLFSPIIADPNTKPLLIASNTDMPSADATYEIIKHFTEETQLSPVRPHQIPIENATYAELMPESFVVSEPPKRKTRYRYHCPGCQVKVYGKPRLSIRCEDCDQSFVSEAY